MPRRDAKATRFQSLLGVGGKMGPAKKMEKMPAGRVRPETSTEFYCNYKNVFYTVRNNKQAQVFA